MPRHQSSINGKIIFWLIILVLLYLLTFGKANFLSKGLDDEKLRLQEKRKLLENRYSRVQDVLNKKKELKTKLEKISRRVLFGVRLGLVMILFAIVSLVYFKTTVSLLDILEYLGLASLILLLTGFVINEIPATFLGLWKRLKKKLTLMIYGKYINIDQHIASHEQELQQMDKDKSKLGREMQEIHEAEKEIEKIITENADDNKSNTTHQPFQ